MKNLNLIKKFFSKVDLKVSVNFLSKLLAEFLNGVIIKVAEDYIYES